MFNSLIEARTNHRLWQFVLHFGIWNLLPDGRSSYLEDRGRVRSESQMTSKPLYEQTNVKNDQTRTEMKNIQSSESRYDVRLKMTSDLFNIARGPVRRSLVGSAALQRNVGQQMAPHTQSICRHKVCKDGSRPPHTEPTTSDMWCKRKTHVSAASSQ